MIYRKALQSSVAITALSLVIGALAWGADPAPMAPAAPTREMRQQMAQAHEKMAACLSSDRDFADCRQEMMQACSNQSGFPGCGMMMGQGMQMRGQGQGQGQRGPLGGESRKP